MSLGLVDISLFGTAGVAARAASDGSLVLLYDASTAAILLSGIGIAGFLAATCVVSARTGLFPAWTNYLGWLVSAGFLVAMMSAGSDANAFAVIGFISFLVWCVWIVVLSLYMWRGTTATA